MKTMLPLALSLLALVGCSKSADPAPAPQLTATPNTASYTLSGRTTTATARATAQTAAASGSGKDVLTIGLEAPLATGGTEFVQVYFAKAPGAAEATYAPLAIHVDGVSGGTGGYYDTPHTMTLSKTAAGGWSGTFSGTSVDASGRPKNTLTSGVFTDVRP